MHPFRELQKHEAPESALRQDFVSHVLKDTLEFTRALQLEVLCTALSSVWGISILWLPDCPGGQFLDHHRQTHMEGQCF